MKSKLLNISGATILTRENQRTIKGQAAVDLSLCGCDCAGRVTGPFYCSLYMACTQEYTCQDVD